MELKKAVDVQRIRVLSATTKETALSELAELICNSAENLEYQELRNGILRREALMSTGIGLGIAVPHVRLEGVADALVAIGVCQSGLADYESIDGEAVRLVVMIVAGKGKHREYIRLLADIVSFLKKGDMMTRILNAQTPEEIHDVIIENT